MIEFEDVSKTFNGHAVFKGLSFRIEKGEVVGLLGRSGVGKSTIFGMIAGLIQPDSGTVKVNSSRIGYIFQEHRLIPWRTALDNLCFGLKATGVNDKEAKEIGREYMEKLGLKGFENYYPHQLSGGMCQRVSIGRAFAISPDLLLMDEPFSSLDLGLKDDMLGIVQDMLAQQPLTLLYITHDPEEVSRLVKRLLLLVDGSQIQELSPEYDKTFKRMLRRRFRGDNLEDMKDNDKYKSNKIHNYLGIGEDHE
jgi:NitT/TauT family transport system ATP-binding protein